MSVSKMVIVTAAAIVGMAGVAYSSLDGRSPVVFYKGHTHDANGTHGAPAHSGGLNKEGCHNASVPYHCH